MFKKLKQAEIYSDAWLKFYQDEIEFPDGSIDDGETPEAAAVRERKRHGQDAASGRPYI